MTPPPRPHAVPRAVPLLFVDLDGTIRHGLDQLGRFVNGPDDVILFPEAVTAMRAWKADGGRIAAVSNQGGIALGHVDAGAVGAAMARTGELAVDERDEPLLDVIRWCEHHPDAGPGCWCRKPRTFLLSEAVSDLMQRYPRECYPPESALMVGDRPEDADCANTAGIVFQWAADWRNSYAEGGAEK